MERKVRLEQSEGKVVIGPAIEVKNELVFTFFDKTPADQYDEAFEKALVLGCYALGLEGPSELFNKVARDLNAELMHLNLLMDLRGLKERSASVSGEEAEANIVDQLQAYADKQQWTDEITSTGATTGVIPRRKVGDAVITIAGTNRRIVVESKADKSVSLGSPTTSDPLTSRTDFEKKTAYGQGLTALANREADVAINVHFEDNAHKTIRDGGIIQLFPEQPAIVVVVDRVAGRWDALHAAYALGRALSLAWDQGTEHWEALDLVIKRTARELNRLDTIDKQIDAIRESAEGILDSLKTMTETREGMRQSLDLMNQMIAALRDNPDDALARRAFFLELSPPE